MTRHPSRLLRTALFAAALALTAFLTASALEPPGVLFRPARLDWYVSITGEFDLGDMDGDGIRDMVAPRGDKVTVLLGRPDGTFVPHFESEWLLSPDEVRLADLDGNGTLDAAVATHNKLAILLGDGHGALGPPVQYDPGSNEGTLAVADFDGDGDIDAAITDYELAVYLNNGDATLTGPDHYEAGLHPRDVEAGDLNLDGHPDLVVASQDDAVQVLLGVGDGTFLPAVPYATGDLPNALKIADMNGDGNPDLVTANFNGESVSVLYGGGTGTFSAQVPIPLGDRPLLLQIGDLDGNGGRDIVAMCRMTYENSGGIRLIAGDGSGSFAPVVLVPTQYEGHGAAITDLDGDGLTDLLVGHSYLSLFRGNGTLDLGAPLYPTAGEPLDMVCDRFDADAVPDLVVLTDGGPEFLRGLGDGSFAAAVSAGPSSVPTELAHGDFDANGTMDLAVVEDGPNQAGIWLNDGNGVFTRHGGFGAGQNPRHVAVGDLNGDDLPDLAIASQMSVPLLFGLGGGDFAGPEFLPAGEIKRIVVADVDEDGAMDLVTIPQGSNARHVDVRYGAGDGTFLASRAYPVSAIPYDVKVRDLDQDGHRDIVTIVSGSLTVLWGRGGRAFEIDVIPAEENHGWVALSSMAIGDVNGDDRLDVLTVRRFQLERVNVFLGSRPNAPQRGPRMQALGYGAGHYPRAIALEDLDGDGDLDVATANGGTHDVSVLLGTAATNALADAAFLSPHGTRDEAAAAAEEAIGLGRPFPSPFRAGTSLPFVLPREARVRVSIFDVGGRLVRVLVDESRGAGAHATSWDGRDDKRYSVPAGIYFVTLEAGDTRETRRVLRLR